MATKVEIEVEHSDKTHTLIVKPKVFRAFEKNFDTTWSRFQENPSLDGTYWLAWQTMLSEGLTKEGFEQWMENLDAVDARDAGSEHPKEETVSPDTTSPSP